MFARRFGMFPDTKSITADLTAKFDQLLAKLQEILDELRKGAPDAPHR